MLIFDFDGVLMDSINEVAVTAHNAITGDLVVSPDELSPDLVALFKLNRFHVQPIGDAILLMDWCIDNYHNRPHQLLTRTEYQDIIRDGYSFLIDRTERFFATRKRFMQKDRVRWLSLHAPFQPIWHELIKCTGHKVIMLTNKDQEATLELCHHFGLPISGQNIYSGDNGATKVENLIKIRERFSCDSYSFVDDSLKNLRELDRHFNIHRKVLKLIFASWGYCGPNDKSMAKACGYEVFDQEDLIDLIRRMET